MNPLLDQFLIEAREQIAAASDGLLKLERDPANAEVLNGVFRSVHTLKGSSGLFDYPAMTSLLHAGEDLFAALRDRRLVLQPDMLDQVLAALDAVSGWFDRIEDSGELPANAGETGAPLGAALRAWIGEGDGTPQPPEPTGDGGAELPGWLAEFARPALVDAARQAAATGASTVAVRYRPEPQCFFKGDDPLALLAQLPECLRLELDTPDVWAPLAEYDPFTCVLGFRALSAAPADEVRHLLRYVADQSEIVEIGPAALARLAGIAPAASPAAAPSQILMTLLDEQRRMLLAPHLPGAVGGCIASAARVAANALDHAGRPAEGERIARAGAEAVAHGDATGLVTALAALLEAQPTAPTPTAPANVPAAEAAKERGSTTLRVDQARIDALMDLIGELVVAKNGLPFLARRAESVYGSRAMAREIKEQHAVIDRIALELRAAIMQVRMLPVSTVFQRFPRLVRDLSRKLDKQVDLVVVGEDTQADKTIIENLFEPLLHLVRNSLDHGIETDRAAAGKPTAATLTLAATQENDQVVISVSDDGRGIDPAAMRRHAVAKGLLEPARAAQLSDAEAVNLIFAAGFSTAEAVTDVSGRGVGMDAVRTTIERSGGRVELVSRLGAGTTVSLHLPLSMAVTSVMTLRVSGEQFGVPMAEIAETVRINRAEIVAIKDREAFLLRQRLIPLVHLDRALGMPAKASADTLGVLVVNVNHQAVGLAIDAFGGSMEVIVKPLEGPIAHVAGYLGTALLGDGKVLLVLDLKEIVK